MFLALNRKVEFLLLLINYFYNGGADNISGAGVKF